MNSSFAGTRVSQTARSVVVSQRQALKVEARVVQKAIKHVMHARPKKNCKADKNRKPHQYAPLPAAPAAFTVVAAAPKKN